MVLVDCVVTAVALLSRPATEGRCQAGGASGGVIGESGSHGRDEFVGDCHDGVGRIVKGGFVFGYGLFVGLGVVVLDGAFDALVVPAWGVVIGVLGCHVLFTRRSNYTGSRCPALPTSGVFGQPDSARLSSSNKWVVGSRSVVPDRFARCHSRRLSV